ncbi:NYN domain-containing protein [Meiothermus sp. QL-1]|uniref:LabA-like NYN domain-containing protein n=1 Tax=Meiothermus sp. QL-1 TaxID=2058095 RepID=UPI000E0B23FA|nr:NYN domain-containing protein [Meiothermus sp. QL-1]RDI94775.1 NYN domain-containing protein [Meiothermus sp. QL-1]
MKTALFIDGSYMYDAAKRLGWNIDHRKAIGVFARPEELYNAFYYAPVTDSNDERQQKFLDALVFMGYTVRSRETHGDPRFEAMIATDLLVTAPRWERAVLASGSGDLAHTLAALRAMGKEIHLLGVPELTDLELRNQCDRYIDLREMQAQLERTGGGRRVYPSLGEDSTATESRRLLENLEDELR